MEEPKLRWSDYAACIGAADMISSGIVYFNPFILIAGIGIYLIWENIRLYEEEQ